MFLSIFVAENENSRSYDNRISLAPSNEAGELDQMVVRPAVVHVSSMILDVHHEKIRVVQKPEF